jgi:hypothetical protein
MRPIDLFHIGPQKTATTWVHRCLSEHPDIFAPASHALHYYDIHYHRGAEWYHQFYHGARDGQVLLDPTMTYIRSTWAPRRIHADNPEASIIVCLRNPIDRAYSHYWHEKKKGTIAFEFEEVLQNYDLYANWMEPGFYAEHIQRYLRYFDREQLLCVRFDTLVDDEEAFLRDIFRFAGVDSSFRPSWLHKKSNEAGGRRTMTNRVWNRMKKMAVQSNLEDTARALRLDEMAKRLEDAPVIGSLLQNRAEYERGIPAPLRANLLQVCEPEIRRLEELLDMDLSIWRRT